jgi:hypothetical protein
MFEDILIPPTTIYRKDNVEVSVRTVTYTLNGNVHPRNYEFLYQNKFQSAIYQFKPDLFMPNNLIGVNMVVEQLETIMQTPNCWLNRDGFSMLLDSVTDWIQAISGFNETLHHKNTGDK